MMNNQQHYNHSASVSYLTNHYQASIDQPYLNQGVSHPHYSHPHTFHPPNPNPRFPMSTPKSEKRKQEILTCDACGIEVNSQQMMDVHIKGQKHIKKMKLKTVSTPTANPSATETNNETSTVTTESTPPTETKANVTPSEKGVLQQINELAKFHKVNAKYDLIKETGPAHAKTFEVKLTLADETYIGSGTSIKRAQQMAAEQALASTILKKHDATARTNQNNRSIRSVNVNTHQIHPVARLPQGPVPMRPRMIPPRLATPKYPEQNKFHEFLLKRYAEITEDESVIETLNLCFEDIEHALKIVSDKLMLNCQSNNMPVTPQLPDDVKFNNNESTDEDPAESFRMLKGSMKVSVSSMNLHLRTDYLYCMVIVCANKPNLTLLNDIAQELDVALNIQAVSTMQLDNNVEQATPVTYKVETPIDQACLHIQCSRLPNHIIQIMLTSPVFRSENYSDFNEEIRQKIEELNPDPLDMLEKDKCLSAAAEIRHSYWFTRCMLENQTNLIVLRLLRDLQNQQTPLCFLNLWSLILVVYKCQSEPIESVTRLFRLVFECLSSGLLLSYGLGIGLIDPCEKEIVDATYYLSIDERLSITNYAQTVLRLIAFEQYDQLFQSAIYSTEETTTDNTLE